jgi:hypothetical protein
LLANLDTATANIVDIPCFRGEVVTINRVWPNAFDDLEDLKTDVELVVELCVHARALAFIVELHEGMQQMLCGEVMIVEGLTENTLRSTRDFPDAVEENRDETRLQVWVFDVFGTPQEHDADLHKLLALSRGDDVRHHTCDELEVTNNVFDKVFRKTFESHALAFRKR